MNLVGTLERQFFGGPVWVLKAEDGAQYQLQGSIPDRLDGEKVQVRGQPSAQGFGFSMVGDVIDVERIKKA